jgi:hypothetical protein
MEQEKRPLFYAVFGPVRQSFYLSRREVAITAVLVGAFGSWAGEANSSNNKKAWSAFLYLFHGVDSQSTTYILHVSTGPMYFVFCRLYPPPPFSPELSRQHLGPTCHLSIVD